MCYTLWQAGLLCQKERSREMSKWLEEAKRFNESMARQLVVGAKYVPADKYTWAPGGVAKSAAAILCECVQGNFLMAAALRGETPAAEGDDCGCALAGLTFEKAKEMVQSSVAAVNDAIAGWEGKDLAALVKLPWGMEMPAEAVIFLPGTHMNYHNGQLNFIQALLGDAEMHWE